MSGYVLLCVIALVAITQALPTIEDNYDHENDYSNDNEVNSLLDSDNLHSDYSSEVKPLRDIRQIVDGRAQYISTGDIGYRQRIIDNKCVVEHNNRYFSEDSIIMIRKKLYRVENCLLERAFHACGPNLLLMLNLVCRVVEKQSTTTTTPAPISFQELNPASNVFLSRIYPIIERKARVITEACCQSLCTLSELSRYCHR